MSSLQVARTLTFDRADELALHLGLVGGAREIERNTPMGVGIVGDDDRPRERERQRRVFAGLVVDEQTVLADVGDLDDLALAVRVEDHAAFVVGAEADRFAVARAG